MAKLLSKKQVNICEEPYQNKTDFRVFNKSIWQMKLTETTIIID